MNIICTKGRGVKRESELACSLLGVMHASPGQLFASLFLAWPTGMRGWGRSTAPCPRIILCPTPIRDEGSPRLHPCTPFPTGTRLQSNLSMLRPGSQSHAVGTHCFLVVSWPHPVIGLCPSSSLSCPPVVPYTCDNCAIRAGKWSSLGLDQTLPGSKNWLGLRVMHL